MSAAVCKAPAPPTKTACDNILCLKLVNCERRCPMARDSRRECRHNEGDIKPVDTRSLVDLTIECVTGKGSKDLLVGTFAGWLGGWALVRVGRVAAFGLGGGVILLHFASECGYINVNWDKVREATHRSQDLVDQIMRFVKRNSCTQSTPEYLSWLTDGRNRKDEVQLRDDVLCKPSPPTPTPALPSQDQEKPPPDSLPKTSEAFTTEDPMFLDKPYVPPKPLLNSPIISPSSIPNPNPSVSTSTMETGYPKYGGYLYSVPGYSAFQPVSYPGLVQPQASVQTGTTTTVHPCPPPAQDAPEDKGKEAPNTDACAGRPVDEKVQTDFEEQFTPEIVPAVTLPETSKNLVKESKMSITSLTQGSGATVTMQPKDVIKKKPSDRFSLKTSIPISKIDMKCVNPPDASYQNSLTKKPKLTISSFQNTKNDAATKVEIQSNIVIRSGSTESEGRPDTKATSTGANNINALINAAEAIKQTDAFRKPEPKTDVINESIDPPMPYTQSSSNVKPVFNATNTDTNKGASTQQEGTQTEQKNQILFIQNNNQSNPKMLLTIQQQSPQVLLQRTNFESKNVQTPSRLSIQSKRCKEDHTDGTASKVVALKRLHQENCDENDFENLITENQIYGNKIVVKEKSQGTQQERDLKKNIKLVDSNTAQETKNVVIQPNFLYLSNVQFPNLMMIKNNKFHEPHRPKQITINESKITTEASTMTSDIITSSNNTPNGTSSKEIHLLKTSNNVVHTFSNKNSQPDLVFQQKLIMNPQLVYQMPVIVDADIKTSQTFSREHPKCVGQTKREYVKQFDHKVNDKLYIACPYQMDSKLHPKIVITNLRAKTPKVDEISSLDMYEKRKRIRRLKYLTHREAKDGSKPDMKKTDRIDNSKNIITPDKMKDEIAREFTNMKITTNETCSESESEYGDDDLDEYNSIIKEFEPTPREYGKLQFLANFRLASREDFKEKQMERQERIIRRDSVAAAYIAVGRIDRLSNGIIAGVSSRPKRTAVTKVEKPHQTQENGVTSHRKTIFLSHLNLTQVSTKYREDYERTWQEIIKERKRRNGKIDHILKQPKPKAQNIDLDTNGQLKMLTEIKKSVNDNNNLIKKRLDSGDEGQLQGDSISVLAEKNFSELNRLSKMADRSVKLITGQENKRDLNPGFDSENIQKSAYKFEQPFQRHPYINIPNITNIISLKSQDAATSNVTSQATSMDEPKSSAAGATEKPEDTVVRERERDAAIQTEEITWPGLEAAAKSYREFDAARKREIAELHRRSTALRVEGAHITRQAAYDADRARALLAERRHLAAEESATRATLSKLFAAVRAIRHQN